MHPKEFLRTIYLGDRACQTLLIDGWNGRVILQATTISRIRSPAGNWDYYSNEDIPNGLIVFTGVTSISLDPPGFVPNDLINSLDVQSNSTDDSERAVETPLLFTAFVDSVSKDGQRVEVQIQIGAQGIHLEDPERPGVKILE